MATLGFFPLGEISHINATLGFAKKLQRCGHRVCYLASPEFEVYIRSQQMEFLPFLPAQLVPVAPRQMSPVPVEQKPGPDSVFELLRRGAFDETLREANFDLLLADSYAPHVAITAYKIGLPVIALSPTVPGQRDAWVAPPESTWTADGWLSRLKIRLWWSAYDLTGFKRSGARETHFRKTLRELAVAAGYPLQQLDFSGCHPNLDLIPELILCPAAFDLPRKKLRNNTHYLGANIALDRKEEVVFLWEKIDRDKLLVYCALGTLSHRFPRAREVLQQIVNAAALRPKWQMVIAIGTHLSRADFRAVPPNVVLVNRAPQLELLQRANLAITHGGLNSVKECILLGVPMLVLPWAAPKNAIRVVYHGLGLMETVQRVTAARVLTLLERLLRDSSFKMRLAQMQRHFRAQENSTADVTLLESFLPSPAKKAA